MITSDGWRHILLHAFNQYRGGSRVELDGIADLLAEQERAKDALRTKGFGCIGMPWAKVVEIVLERERGLA
jgi:hypothetical protein